MLRRTVSPPPEHLYPGDPWRVVETGWTAQHAEHAETAFALANGYLGVRGTVDECRPSRAPGTFVNGFHETWPIVHPETAYGLATTGQTMVNAPDATCLRLYVDDEPLFLPVARLPEYERVLDMRAGTLTRRLVWTTPSGKHVQVRSTRLVSLESRHLLAVRFEVTVLDAAAPVVVSSQLVNRQDRRPVEEPGPGGGDPRTGRTLVGRVLLGQGRRAEGTRAVVGYRTAASGMRLGVGIDHVVECADPVDLRLTSTDDETELTLTLDGRPGVPLVLTKYASYHSSRGVTAAELMDRCDRTLDRAVRGGFAAVVTAQREHLDRFWDRADVRLDTAGPGVRMQQAVRWSLFQLAQASWRAEGGGIPAKGLTGSAYDGHYFWDTEAYVLPFLTHTSPRIARNVLRFRAGMLEAARERARQLGHRGALFPWRTINGQEASANFQAGTAQYHIDADIAFAVRAYLNVRGDPDFLAEVGAELLAETARLWEDLGFYGDDGRFHVHGVTGPDEYTTVVNDNAYTNLMAQLNLRTAARELQRLQEEQPAAYAVLAERLSLEASELVAWQQAADAMYVPFDPVRGIHPQDEHFLEREVWDLASTPAEQFPLLLHHHPLTIYRYQVLKQADIVLAMFLLGEHFSVDQKRRNFDYYDPLTTGDSSLSACVQSIVAAEVGHDEAALEHFRYALLMDIGDAAGNASDGVHIASAAGVWLSLVFGFGGLSDFDGEVHLRPRLPRAWRSLSYSVRIRGRQLRVTLGHDTERYLVDEGEALEVVVRGNRHLLLPGSPLELPAPGSRPGSGPLPPGST